MKAFLTWFTTNIKAVSFIAGVMCVAAGETEVGNILINNGAL